MRSVEEPGGGRDAVARDGVGPEELLRIHDELDRLIPTRGMVEGARSGVIAAAAAWASWMILGTAADLGLVWPFAIALAVGWSVSLGITVSRRLRIRELRRRLREAGAAEETGGPESG